MSDPKIATGDVKFASPLCERLVNQIMLSQQRDDELLFYTRMLAQYSADKQTLSDKIASMQHQFDRVESVRLALLSTFNASRQQYQKVIEEDETKRKQLSAELQARIHEVNEYSERVTQHHAKALHENAALKEQITLLTQHRSTGEGKFEELVQAREKEVQNLKDRLASEVAREPLLVDALEKANELCATIRTEHDVWKSRVDGFVAKFNDIQQKLVDAKNSFDEAKDERDRISRRITSLEADRAQAINRAERAKNERNVELAKATELEQKCATLEAQIKKLVDLCAVLMARDAASGEAKTAA